MATANLPADTLRDGMPDSDEPDAVRRRRRWPTNATLAMQSAIQDNILVPAVTGDVTLDPPLPRRLVTRVPVLQRLMARLLGIGVRPEHVRSRVA